MIQKLPSNQRFVNLDSIGQQHQKTPFQPDAGMLFCNIV
jgi:hypothetical protein